MLFLNDDIYLSLRLRHEGYVEYSLYLEPFNYSQIDTEPIYTGKIYTTGRGMTNVHINDLISEYRVSTELNLIGTGSVNLLMKAIIIAKDNDATVRAESPIIYMGYSRPSVKTGEYIEDADRANEPVLVLQGNIEHYKHVLYPKYPAKHCPLSMIAIATNQTKIDYDRYGYEINFKCDREDMTEEDGYEPTIGETFMIAMEMGSMFEGSIKPGANIELNVLYGQPGDTDDDYLKVAEFDCDDNRFYLQWQDRCGGIQCQPFKGKSTYSESISNTQIENVFGHKRNVVTTIEQKWDLNTTYIKDECSPIFESIFQSPFIRLYDSKVDKVYEVLTVGKAYTEKTFKNNGKKCFNFSLTVQLDKNQVIMQ